MRKRRNGRRSASAFYSVSAFYFSSSFGAVFAERSVNAATMQADLNEDELRNNPEVGKKLSENSPFICAAEKTTADPGSIDLTKQAYVDAATAYVTAALADGGALGAAFSTTPGAP